MRKIDWNNWKVNYFFFELPEEANPDFSFDGVGVSVEVGMDNWLRAGGMGGLTDDSVDGLLVSKACSVIRVLLFKF